MENLKHPLIKATVVADSISYVGVRITTVELVLPRIVLAELNTHRAFSRNSASSRAIPFNKMVKEVLNNPFTPIAFQRDHSGMQGTEYLAGSAHAEAYQRWLIARDRAVEQAIELSELGVTKQLCNRLLEPFLMHRVLITATDWDNFFALRAHEAAEIHIQDAANKILTAMNESTPKKLQYMEWHIPFGDKIDESRLAGSDKHEIERTKIKIASARCARVSYNNFEGKDDYEADIALHDRLVASGHMSPMEHIAQAGMDSTKYSGNLRGFTQYRKMLPNENRTDERLYKHPVL